MTLVDYQKALHERRVLFINGEINSDSLEKFRKQIDELFKQPGKEEIVLSICSSGGNTTSGICFYHDLCALGHGNKLWVVCQGSIGSMAIPIVMSVSKEMRVAFNGTDFYFHRISLNFKIDQSGPASQHRYRLKEYEARINDVEREELELISIISDSTGMSTEKVIELVDNPRYIAGQELIDLGLIDHFIK